jgi:hypothetical protein
MLDVPRRCAEIELRQVVSRTFRPEFNLDADVGDAAVDDRRVA